MSDLPTVTAVLLSHNRPGIIREALASVVDQTYPNLRVLVIDNRSPASDRIREIVAGFPGVEIFASAINSGFAGGMNLGLRYASGKYVLFTEDDIVVDRKALEVLVRYLEVHPGVGLAGAVMLNRATGTIRCAGGEVRLGQRFEFRVIDENEAFSRRGTNPYRVTYLPGAFILARRELLDRIGGFWHQLFMYHDDVELCVRANRAGAEIAVVPEARVWHFDPPAQPVPGWLADLKVRNMLWLYVRHAPIQVLIPFVARYYLVGFIRGLVTNPRYALALARAVVATGVRLPMLLTRRWARPLRDVVGENY